MKTLRLKLLTILVILLFITGCQNDDEPKPVNPVDVCLIDPCSRPDICACSNPYSELKEEDLSPRGTVTETDDGFIVEEGELQVSTGTDSVVFEDAKNLEVKFNEDGKVEGITGEAKIPNIEGVLYFPDLVTADIGYFSGAWLNENRDFDITLIDSISYFVFNISLDVSVSFGDPNDPNVTPITLSVPVGGHLTLITNYRDPFFYFSAAQDLVGHLSMAGSFQGLIPFVPLQPMPEFQGFYGKSFRGGSFSVFKLLGVNGTVVQEKVFDTGITTSEPVPGKLEVGYKYGINGEFVLSMPIKGKKMENPFLEISMPIGEASAGIIAIADTENGIIGKAFINGLQTVNNGWFPDFIPLTLGTDRRVWGYLQQDGYFDIGISGNYYFIIPGYKQITEGSMRFTNDSVVYEGSIIENDVKWVASMVTQPGISTVTLDPPTDYTEGLAEEINALIDDKIDSVITVTEELDEAKANYEFEVSLRGLRSELPNICNNAKALLDQGIKDGLKKARETIDNNLKEDGLKRCSDNLTTVVNDAAKPYYDAINSLKSAANISDDEVFKTKIEAALRDLIARKTIDETVSGSIKATLSWLPCPAADTYTRSYHLKVQVIGGGVIARLQEAADNVKYIQESSDWVVTLQEVMDQLPIKEDLEKLKADLHSGVKQIPSFENIGYTKALDSPDYTFFVTLSGERHEIAAFNIFSGFEVKNFLVNDMMKD